MVRGRETAEPDLVGGARDHVPHDPHQPPSPGADLADQPGKQLVERLDPAAPHQMRVPCLRHTSPLHDPLGKPVPLDDGDIGALREGRRGEQPGEAAAHDEGGGTVTGTCLRHGCSYRSRRSISAPTPFRKRPPGAIRQVPVKGLGLSAHSPGAGGGAGEALTA